MLSLLLKPGQVPRGTQRSLQGQREGSVDEETLVAKFEHPGLNPGTYMIEGENGLPPLPLWCHVHPNPMNEVSTQIHTVNCSIVT